MLIEEALILRWKADTALEPLVSDRFYITTAPQNAKLPHVTFNSAGGNRLYSMTGPSQLNRATFHVHVWAATPAEAKRIAAAIRESLSGYKGLVGEVFIEGCFVDDDLDLYDDESFEFHTVIKLIVWHRE